jgi:hypothetical protein
VSRERRDICVIRKISDNNSGRRWWLPDFQVVRTPAQGPPVPGRPGIIVILNEVKDLNLPKKRDSSLRSE